jgi:hypothetical protein
MKKDLLKEIQKEYKTNVNEKSIRTTFKFSEKSLNAIDWLCNRFEITQKELFKMLTDGKNYVEKIANYIKESDDINSDGLDKRMTKVLSKKTIDRLDEISEQYEISRNLLLDKLILFIWAIEQQTVEKHEKVREKLVELMGVIDDTQDEIGEKLEKDDPVYIRTGLAYILIDNLVSAIDNESKTGQQIDPDEL